MALYLTSLRVHIYVLKCTQDWLVTLNSSRTTEIMYIDVSRTFDSIVFNKWFDKLESYGINGKLLHWIASFVKDRYQCVAIENCSSSVAKAISGVPQGSVLNPSLCITFINVIDSVCHGRTNIKLFLLMTQSYIVNYTSMIVHYPYGRLSTILQLGLVAWQLSMNVRKYCVLSTVINKRTIHSCFNK